MTNGKIDRAKEATLTADQLRAVLSYDPATGFFTWLFGSVNKVRAGARAGYRQPDGQRVIRIRTISYVAHRLAWLYVTGEWPKDLVDHKNMDRDDNRWDNLRAATKGQNGANRGPQTNNKSGHKGVYLVRNYYVSTGDDAWKAEIMIDQKHHHIGYYRTAGEAISAHAEKARELFGEFARVA